MDVDIAGSREGDFVCDSNEAIVFKLVRSEEDIEDDDVFFRPEMSHQIFGQSESIYGYKDLEVKLYYSACRLTMYLGMEYSSVVDPRKSDGIEPDNVLKVLQEKLQVPNICTNIDEFVKSLKDEDSFQPFGEKLSAFTVEKDTGSVSYEIYHCDTSNQKFLNFHERLQTFILFFIDAASFIDVDDSKWQFFVLYEKFKSPGKTRYAVAGYCTVYEYYAYPDRLRPRVAQMLVLPPFQRCRLGARLLCAVYQRYRSNDSVADITVEDPSDEFRQMRDFVDVSLCSGLDSFSPKMLKEGFSPAMATEACDKYKINKKQARRVYEILRLKETNVHDKNEYSAFRLDIKKRLNQAFQREAKFSKKLAPILEKNPELSTSLGLKTQEQIFETLEALFSETEKEYNTIIERIQKRPLEFSC